MNCCIAGLLTALVSAPTGDAVVAVFDIELSGVTLKATTLDGLNDYLFNKIAGVEGKLHGDFQEFGGDDYARKQEQGSYVRGKKHGLWRQYATDGSVASESPYVQDKLHGEVVRWSITRDGKRFKRSVEQYAAGKLHGTAIQYRPDGSVSLKERYERGHKKR